MDEAEKWLRENDPNFADTYLTNARMKKIQRKEIPFSSFRGDLLEYISEGRTI